MARAAAQGFSRARGQSTRKSARIQRTVTPVSPGGGTATGLVIFNVDGSNDKTVGTADSSNQFWTGTNGSRCTNYSGSLAWSFASDGKLVVTLGGKTVSLS